VIECHGMFVVCRPLTPKCVEHRTCDRNLEGILY